MALRNAEPAGCQALKELQGFPFNPLCPFNRLGLEKGVASAVSGGKAFRQTAYTRGSKPDTEPSVGMGLYSLTAPAAFCSPLAESGAQCFQNRQRDFPLQFLSSPSTFHLCTLRKAAGKGPGRAASLHTLLQGCFLA